MAAALVVALVLVPPAAAAGPGSASLDTGPSPGGAALRSLVLPGWGQAANGRWLKSAVAFGVYAGYLGWGISLNQDKQDAVGRFNAAATDSARAVWEAEVDRLDSDRNGKYWIAGFATLMSMLDAYVDAHLRNFDKRMDAEVGWIPVSGGEPALGIRLTLTWDGDAVVGKNERGR
jgi:hypothetical protein